MGRCGPALVGRQPPDAGAAEEMEERAALAVAALRRVQAADGVAASRLQASELRVDAWLRVVEADAAARTIDAGRRVAIWSRCGLDPKLERELLTEAPARGQEATRSEPAGRAEARGCEAAFTVGGSSSGC